MTAAILGAMFFCVAGYAGAIAGSIAADRITALPDGPPSHEPPVPLLVLACAALGAITVSHTASHGQVLIVAIVCAALVAIWITDARRGIVPDIFTLGPLALLIVAALWQHEWRVLIAAAIPFAPFGLTALLSKGRGMGWGDAKLVALGGIVLGPQIAVVAFALACFAAVVVNYRRGHKTGVIAFAPYLACAIGAAIPFELLH